MPRPKSGKETLARPSPSYLRLPPELYDALEELAEASGLSRHSVTLLALRRGLASLKEERAVAKGDLRFLVEEHVRLQTEALYRARGKRKTSEENTKPEEP